MTDFVGNGKSFSGVRMLAININAIGIGILVFHKKFAHVIIIKIGFKYF